MWLLRSVSVRTRLLAALLCVSIIPVLLIGISANRVYTRLITRELSDFAAQTIRRIDAELSTKLRRFEMVIDAVSISSEVQDALLEQRSDLTLRREIERLVIRGGDFHELYVVGRDGAILYESGFLRISKNGFDTLRAGADAASSADSLYHIRGAHSGYLTLGRKIFRFPDGQEHIGYIFVFINEELPGEEFFQSFEDGGVILLSSDGTVLAGDRNILGTRLDDSPLFGELLAAESDGRDSFITALNELQSYVVFNYNERYDTYLLAAVPLRYIHEGTEQTGRRLIILIIVTILLCILVSFVVYRSVSKPINRIIAKCESEADSGRIDDNSSDEIGFLARAVDQYAADLEFMTQIRIDDQRRKRDLELKALQYQINPHFLFNTLSTLKWVAVMDGASPVVSDGIAALSQLLRSVLLNKDEMVPLHEELENLMHYFTIQKIRYADCFKVVEDIDASILTHHVPRFILQPLAENAVIHGSAGGERDIIITVRCKKVSGGIRLEIQDNGSGFDPEAAQHSNEEKFSGIGLANVNERLMLYFGKALEIESVIGEGTICRVFVPDMEE